MRKGQVALYLVLVLVAICVLAVMNVGVFLSVREKNRTMNAGDAAALAVARYQGELLNRIGMYNLSHLKMLIECRRIPDEPPEVTRERIEECRRRCRELEDAQARACFLEPLGGITVGNRMAQENGIRQSDDMLNILKQHVIDVRTIYAANPESYPPPWEGAWEEYAQRLETEIGGGMWAGPDNIDFIDDMGGHLLLERQFYNAVAGRNWCWFHFNAKGVLDSYSSFRDWPPLPNPDDETRRRRCANSEVYSLHLLPRAGGALVLLGAETVKRLTGATDEDLEASLMIGDAEQVWYFYGYEWNAWSTYPYINFNPNDFPIVGEVKPEYDVLGCAAVCRVYSSVPDVVTERDERIVFWSAAAKPFGTVQNENGDVDVVTANGRFVTPAFEETRLVPIDSVGGRDLSTADAGWMTHVREHLPLYLLNGPLSVPCWYCWQLKAWESDSLRREAREWLKYNSKSCVRPTGSGTMKGGTMHAH